MSRVILPFKTTSPLVFPGRKASFDSSHPFAKGCFWSVVSLGASAINLCKPSPKPTAQVSAPTRVIDGALGIASKFTGVTSNSLVFTGGSKAQVDLAFTYACFYRPATIASNTSIVSNSTTVNTGSLLSYNTGNACLILGSELVAPMLSGINLIVGVPYFIVASATGPSASTSTWTHNWVVVRLDTGQITTATGTSSQSWAASNGNMLFGGASSGQGNLDADGNLAAAMYSNVFTSVPQMLQWAQDPWAFWYPRTLDLADMLSAGSGGTVSTTISPAQGGYTLSGKAQLLNSARSIAAVQGSYSLTGEAVTLTKARVIAIVQGSYGLTGEAISFAKALSISPVQGSYTLTGKATGLNSVRTIAATQGVYTLTGKPQTLTYTPQFIGTGSYSLSGKAVTLSLVRNISTVQGSYGLTGEAVVLTKGKGLAPAQGVYGLTGEAVTLTKALSTSIVQGSYTLSGKTINLNKAKSLASGSYGVTGHSVTFPIALSDKPTQGSYGLTGFPVVMTLTTAGGAAELHGSKFFADVGQMTTK